MKIRTCLLVLTAVVTASFVMADIQAPPGARWGWSRKLSRAVANLAYGVTEINETHNKIDYHDGSSAAFSSTVIQGTGRTVVRIGYGLFELVTFPFPTYHGTYKPPYYKKDYMHPVYGYSEFPPQIGIQSEAHYSRTQPY
jgi:putative exosortase-associated protein (TIGR04073 family)